MKNTTNKTNKLPRMGNHESVLNVMVVPGAGCILVQGPPHTIEDLRTLKKQFWADVASLAGNGFVAYNDGKMEGIQSEDGKLRLEWRDTIGTSGAMQLRPRDRYVLKNESERRTLFTEKELDDVARAMRIMLTYKLNETTVKSSKKTVQEAESVLGVRR